MQPLVSVVVPTRNRVDLLRRAVQTVLAQSERNFELLIVDDASTDATAAYLTELQARDTRVRVIRNATAGGGGAARNSGIFSAAGLWVAFLDDDDEWLPEKLELQLATLRARPAAIACSCGYIAQLALGVSRVVTAAADVTLRELLADNVLGGASMCIGRTQVLRDIGGFDPRLRSAQDSDLWVRLRQRGEILSYPRPLVVHWAHGGLRITTNMQAQYEGLRRFYFKHRALMDETVRRHRMAYNCFVMSRQQRRKWWYRLRYLRRSVHWARRPFAFAYLRSSLPRLLGDAIRTPFGARE